MTLHVKCRSDGAIPSSDVNERVRQLAFYGKGGVGKTTIVANLSVAFALAGKRVLLVGCDPKQDSSRLLVERGTIRTVMGQVQAKGRVFEAESLVMRGRAGVDCIETGGPEPGVGCAGRGVSKMFEILKEIDLLSGYDVVMFDVLGDVVCGGFAAPMRIGVAREVYIVASGEIMSLWATNNISRAVVRHNRNGTALAGIIPNLRGLPGEQAALEAFASRLGAPLLPALPRLETIYNAERASAPVLLHAPESDAARAFSSLYEEIERMTEKDRVVPRPLDEGAFEELLSSSFGRQG